MQLHIILAGLVALAQASFYDNPELDPIPEGGTPLEELQAKWGADV